MQNLATLLIAGLRKYHRSISRPNKITRCDNFVKIFYVLDVSNFETIFRHFQTVCVGGRVTAKNKPKSSKVARKSLFLQDVDIKVVSMMKTVTFEMANFRQAKNYINGEFFNSSLIF